MNKPDCTIYEGGKVPPCSAFLSNTNPIIKDGKIIFRNLNRLFYFISASSVNASNEFNASMFSANIQISLSTFIIGLFINQIETGIISYDEGCIIHSNKEINDFIHKTLQNPPILEEDDFIPSLTLAYSNGNAILDPFTFALNISKLNFFILLIISRLEMNLGLFFVNNSFATEDCINFFLASLNIQCPFEDEHNKKADDDENIEPSKTTFGLSKEELNKLYELLTKI